jgi:hypothetical protein
MLSLSKTEKKKQTDEISKSVICTQVPASQSIRNHKVFRLPTTTLEKNMDLKDALRKYRAHTKRCESKLDAARQPVKMLLSFEEWCDIWLQSGMWDLRRPGGACMARHNDLGHYAIGNVSIKINAENVREACLGKKTGPKSAEHKAKLSAALLGKKTGPKSAETRAKIGAALRRTKQF